MSGLVDHTASPASEADAPPRGGAETPVPALDAPVGLRARARVRRRVRYLRQLRELELRDLGGFLVEQFRFGRENPAVVRAKLEAAAGTDRELRELERALGEREGVRELREPGVGGACEKCGTVHGSSDRYCSWCGRKL